MKNINPALFLLIAILFVGLIGVFIFPIKNPQLIVNMPQNAQPLEQLTDKVIMVDAKVISNERAILWWTVFKYGSEKSSPAYAVGYANEAVEAAYGKVK